MIYRKIKFENFTHCLHHDAITRLYYKLLVLLFCITEVKKKRRALSQKVIRAVPVKNVGGGWNSLYIFLAWGGVICKYIYLGRGSIPFLGGIKKNLIFLGEG